MWRLSDLHVHTPPNEQNADPIDAPRLVAESLAQGVQVIAVTNHDHLGALDDVIQAADRTGLEVVSGVEITTDNGHLLALAPRSRGPQVIA
jgi:predicted metal-dependent phosphoesterase TrpH